MEDFYLYPHSTTTFDKMKHITKYDIISLLILILLHILGYYLIRYFEKKVITLWILFEFVLIFTHFPFLFSKSNYWGLEASYKWLNSTLIWGIELMSPIFACLLTLAPKIVLINSFLHLNYITNSWIKGITAEDRLNHVRSTIAYWIILLDNIIHFICLYHYITFMKEDRWIGILSFIGLVCTCTSLTILVHKNQLKFWNLYEGLFTYKKEREDRRFKSV